MLLLKELLKHYKRLWIYDFIIKNIYINKLDDIVDKYNNTCHRTIDMKSANFKWSIYVDFDA